LIDWIQSAIKLQFTLKIKKGLNFYLNILLYALYSPSGINLDENNGLAPFQFRATLERYVLA